MQQKDTDQRNYFENMSIAFASLCDVFATVMDAGITPKSKTFDAVNKAGIWFKNEFPALQRGYFRNKVYQIEAVSPDGLIVFPYWSRKGMTATHAGDHGATRVVDHTPDIEDADTGALVTQNSRNFVTRLWGRSNDVRPRPAAEIVARNEVLKEENDVEEVYQDDVCLSWWEEDGVLDEEELENWELDSK